MYCNYTLPKSQTWNPLSRIFGTATAYYNYIVKFSYYMVSKLTEDVKQDGCDFKRQIRYREIYIEYINF